MYNKIEKYIHYTLKDVKRLFVQYHTLIYASLSKTDSILRVLVVHAYLMCL
jgi:hypothetical protein